MTRSAEYNSNGWSASLSQPLFRWQNWVGYKQAELAAALAEMQFSQASQDLIVRVTQAYFDVLLAQETLATAQAQKIAIAEQLESAKRNFEVGTTTITDTHEAQARYDLAAATEIFSENDLAVKRQTLLTVTGKDPGALKGLRPSVQIGSPQPADIGQWVTSAESGNIGVQMAQTNLEIASREIGRQRAGHYPTLDLVATHGRSCGGGQLVDNDWRGQRQQEQHHRPATGGAAFRRWRGFIQGTRSRGPAREGARRSRQRPPPGGAGCPPGLSWRDMPVWHR